jgi:photosystem II stability/assembly factor-like uncharacterized protein
LPIWGADVRSLAVHPKDPDLALAGTASGQVYLSRNGGGRWENAGASLPFAGWVVSALLFDPHRPGSPGHPGRLWAGLRGVWGGGHVAWSDDLGKSWVSRAAGLSAGPVYSLAVAPGRPGRLYAGTGSGVWGSDDDGASWHPLTTAVAEIHKVTSLLAQGADFVIAGTWRRAYGSGDGGKTWIGLFEGMVLDSEVFSLTPAPDQPDEIWATTCGWVYRSTDRGTTWSRFKEGFQERRTPSFAALPGGRLLAGTVAGLHASDDGGATWSRVGDPALSIQGFAVHPGQPERVLVATEGAGVWLSLDGGRSLRPASEGMTNLRVSALAAAGGELLVGVGHAGPFSGVHTSKDGGASFGDGFRPLPGVLALQTHQGKLFAGTERGLFERRGSDWHRVGELGQARVEQLATDGSRFAVRTSAGLWEMSAASAGKLAPRPFTHGAPRSALLAGDALWVASASGLYRLTAEANDTISTPFAGGRLARVGGQLLYWGSGGAFTRGEADGAWLPVTSEGSRLLPTGDPRWEALLITGDAVRLFDAQAKTFRAIETPVPARDISAALVSGGSLFLGTSGYGVLVRALPHPPGLPLPGWEEGRTGRGRPGG